MNNVAETVHACLCRRRSEIWHDRHHLHHRRPDPRPPRAVGGMNESGRFRDRPRLFTDLSESARTDSCRYRVLSQRRRDPRQRLQGRHLQAALETRVRRVADAFLAAFPRNTAPSSSHRAQAPMRHRAIFDHVGVVLTRSRNCLGEPYAHWGGMSRRPWRHCKKAIVEISARRRQPCCAIVGLHGRPPLV